MASNNTLYSSLKFTKLFDIIAFNLRLKRPYEVSKVVTFILVLQRRKQAQRSPAPRPGPHGPKQQHQPRGEIFSSSALCTAVRPHLRRLWRRFRACFVFVSGMDLTKEQDGTINPGHSCWKICLLVWAACGTWNLKQSTVGGRQRDLPLVAGSSFWLPLWLHIKKEAGNLRFCHCYNHFNSAMPLENWASFVMKNNCLLMK